MNLKQTAAELKVRTLTVYHAARDPRTPWLVRGLALLIAAYALSPIDLIPDFIPVIGYLDDLLLIPAGLALIIWLTPVDIIATSRQKAEQTAARPVSYGAALIIVILWSVALLVFTRHILLLTSSDSST